MSERRDSGLAEFFVAGVEPSDVPQFHSLVAARPLIGAMIALFRGGDDEVMVRLMVLREIGLRADAPEWTPRDLVSHFSFIAEAKLNTVLGRLREHELLLWDSERRIYQLSSAGRMVLSALSSLISFGSEQDGELGFLAAQIAAGSAVGKQSPEALAHLLARLGELEEEFSQAVTSGSEFRLRAAQAKLASVQKWMDKANQVMRELADDGLDEGTWKLSQQIGQRQSRLMRMSSVFQRELAEISRQQVHTWTTSRSNRPTSWQRSCACCRAWNNRCPWLTASSAAALPMPPIACRCCPSSANRTWTRNWPRWPNCPCACAGKRHWN